MYIVDADVVLANMLLYRELVTVRQLNEARGKIEKRFHNCYVDITRDNIVWTMNNCTDMFELRDDTVTRKRTWSKEFVNEYYNWRVHESVREEIVNILRNVV